MYTWKDGRTNRGEFKGPNRPPAGDQLSTTSTAQEKCWVTFFNLKFAYTFFGGNRPILLILFKKMIFIDHFGGENQYSPRNAHI